MIDVVTADFSNSFGSTISALIDGSMGTLLFLTWYAYIYLDMVTMILTLPVLNSLL